MKIVIEKDRWVRILSVHLKLNLDILEKSVSFSFFFLVVSISNGFFRKLVTLSRQRQFNLPLKAFDTMEVFKKYDDFSLDVHVNGEKLIAKIYLGRTRYSIACKSTYFLFTNIHLKENK